jgi:ABC-type polysaccharide/polyol phosphate transport system ATPase subunit
MNNNIAIQLTNISKSYTIRHDHPLLLSRLTKAKSEKFLALNNINLKIMKGERIGIIGPNGSGKTTLLKIISGITTPTSGEVITNGKIASLINLEAGFHPDLTGYQNIFLNGSLLGLPKREIVRNLNKIIEIADISSFIDAPFYTYSNGMKFRLAFAVAIISRCQIFIMDEVFVSGDMDFQKKSLQMITQLQKDKNVTTIICSHVPAYVLKFSQKNYILKKGNISHMSQLALRKHVNKINKLWVSMFLPDYIK